MIAGRYRSGQPGQTVNLLALCLRRFESYSAHHNHQDSGRCLFCYFVIYYKHMRLIDPNNMGYSFIKILSGEVLLLLAIVVAILLL